MIGTDKYTGHAQGEWTIEQNETGDECAINSQDYGTIAQTFYRDHDKLFMATTRLIADAPLLSAEVKRLQALIRSKGLCTNCGQSHEGIEVVMDYSEDEVGHRISKECVGTCHPNLSVHCCDLCLCLNGFTIEHAYWEAKKND